MKKYKVTVNGTAYEIEVEEISGEGTPAAKETAKSEPVKSEPAQNTNGGTQVVAPMPGNILDIKVKVGDTVKKGDVLMILEAMKMENEIMADADGKVLSIGVNKGDSVETGKILLVIG